MNDKILAELTKIVEVQTGTIKDIMDICTMLKDRIEVLEGKVNK